MVQMEERCRWAKLYAQSFAFFLSFSSWGRYSSGSTSDGAGWLVGMRANGKLMFLDQGRPNALTYDRRSADRVNR